MIVKEVKNKEELSGILQLYKYLFPDEDYSLVTAYERKWQEIP